MNLLEQGNKSGNDIIPFRGHNYYNCYRCVGWEGSKYNRQFEHYIIDMHLSWKDIN